MKSGMLGLTKIFKRLVVGVGLVTPGSAPAVETAKELPPANVYLWLQQGIPIGLAQKLAHDVGERLEIEVAVIPGYQLARRFHNASRNQYISDEILADAKSLYAKRLSETKSILIVLLKEDLFTTSFDWRYCFGLYSVPGNVSVLSIARLDETFYDEPANAALLYKRARKFITRYIGAQYFKLPFSENKNSVLYETILGLDDLDMIGEDF